MKQTPWAIILCKFTDNNSEPFPRQYYEDLFTTNDKGSPWNMVRYFHDCSQGNTDVSGSKVFGWFQLNKSVADYNALGGAARGQLIQWARAAAQAANNDLTPFFNTVVCTNLWHDIGETGNGVVAQGTTAIPSLLGHEMGHGFGLQHSRLNGSTQDYQDPWDIMSAANDFPTSDPNSEFSTIGPGMNAANMRFLNWLDESRVWKGSNSGYDETIKLRPLMRHDLPGWVAADFEGYLLEFRIKEGWDAGIPQACVLVHYFSDGHSYLMPGNGNKEALLTGDSFGDPDPVDKGLNLFSSYSRVDVVAIDTHHREATLRLRYRAARQIPVAIDPMRLILSDAAYTIWAEAKHPHVPDVAAVQKIVATMSPAELESTLTRAQTLTAYGHTVTEAIRDRSVTKVVKATGAGV
jgi:hypothetical protein